MAPIIPVPITSPIIAQINFPLDTLYKTPEKNAPKTAPVKAKGGIPIKNILITPINIAQSSEYQGPRITEHRMLIKWAIGHIPSIRRIGEITTPIATIIANISFFNSFEFFSIIKYLLNNIKFPNMPYRK